jgi:prepilin-type N-terminal cleavage/methylation domain-containing protein/prepilin-type processing-associated H-X9-DG protein
MRKAFTLIELLVVIAIIAILAAILFPVFAQAKLAAKKTVVMSNAKEICTAQLMYVNDSDDTSPSLGVGDWTDHLYPYIKNEDVFLNPLRNDFDGGCLNAVAGGATPPGAGSDEPGCKYVGFGYNWGPIKRRGGGMLGRQQPDPNRPAGNFYIPGISETSIVSPADMFNYTCDYDTPRITMGIFFFMCTFKGTSTAQMFFGGKLPVSFADGHAKSVNYIGGFGDPAAENNMFATPANLSMITDYCFDPSTLVDTSGDTGGADGEEGTFPPGTTCAMLPSIFASFPHAAYYSGASTKTYFSN